ncbi:TerB N-terminal domain-containing protein [Acetobacterium bakii]|uniref:TerB-C domain-containing protein n=1 Tax=Acetobacterium bakii TaxID=52689 RepID=A0A0L6U351_9FIRM|nr:TerB N-terminal domain-containing protein [Acetobacterium bakii]KNZ42933.1 hypothetical protein AKG39_04225 [Acetobacterium bakii]
MDTSILKLINDALVQAKNEKYVLNDGNIEKSHYQPEPIIKKASELAMPAPKRYKEMLKIEPNNNTFSWQSDYINARFYLQAKFMESFEDDYAYYGEILRYLPQYTDMTFPELRGYFTWRTKVRKGIIEETNISFVFVYIYELINGIGADSPKDGFQKLLYIWNVYTKFNNKIDRYLKDWLKDYVIYYEMDPSRIKDIPIKRNHYLFVLSDIQNAVKKNDFSEFLKLINGFSNYKIHKSKFLKEFQNDYIDALAVVYTDLEKFYNNSRKTTLFEKMFGKESREAWVPFRSGIFYGDTQKNPRKCIVNDFERYECTNGEWLKYSYSEYNVDKRFIGEVLRTTEFFLREIYDYSYKITFKSTSKLLTNLIEKSIISFCEENNKKDLCPRMKENQRVKKKKKKEMAPIIKIEPVRIEIDPSKFDEIRKTAQDIQRKLIVESVMEKEKEILVEKTKVVNNEKEQGMEVFSKSLTIDEKEIIREILNNQSEKIDEIAKEKNKMVTVLLEAINEKALTFIEDNIIETNDEKPWIYDEYREELLEVL